MYNIIDDKNEKIKNLSDKKLAIYAINALLKYLEDTQKTSLDHINTIKIYNTTRYMALDINARRNLEITKHLHQWVVVY